MSEQAESNKPKVGDIIQDEDGARHIVTGFASDGLPMAHCIENDPAYAHLILKATKDTPA